MSNRSYLCCTNFPNLPKKSQTIDFLKNSGTEYEAKACIPIFWMCLFSSEDIKISPANHNGFDDDERPYAYLACRRVDAISRLKSRSSMMEKALGVERYELYKTWISRFESELFEFVIVRTEELDWMGDEGELESTLRKAMKHLEKNCLAGEMLMSNAMNDIAGLWSEETLNECESYELTGVANSKNPWPNRFTPAPVFLPLPSKRSWWMFWK